MDLQQAQHTAEAVIPSLAFAWTLVFLHGNGAKLAMHEAEKVRPRYPKSAEHRLEVADDLRPF